MPTDSPHPVDVHVGTRIRARRKALNISQTDLADALGLTFQQVQKYERGSNRISASKLWKASQFLKMPIAYFFEDFGEKMTSDSSVDDTVRREEAINAFLLTGEGVELAKAFSAVKGAKTRRKVMELIRVAADERTV